MGVMEIIRKDRKMNNEQKRLLALVYNQNVALDSIRGLLKFTIKFINERCNADIEEITGFKKMITHIHKTSQKAYSDSIAITDMVENMVK